MLIATDNDFTGFEQGISDRPIAPLWIRH